LGGIILMANHIIKTNNKKDSLSKAKSLIDITNKLTIKSLVINSNNLNLKEDRVYIGIDFGTSTTVVSIASANDNLENVKSYSIELNQKLFDGAIYKSYKIPTMIGWYNNTLLVGQGANYLKQKLKQGKNLWHSFKMELGEDMGAKYPESMLNNEKIKLLNPKDVTTLFFKYLKTQIEKYVNENNLSRNIEYAVSIPASFEANQRKDLLDSLHNNNMMLEKQSLIDEPNAAFLSYVANSDIKESIYISDEYPTNILVFDFGAGTCDISILEIVNTVKGYQSKNLAISRFEALGGNDIDKKIAEDILYEQFLKENNIKDSIFKTKEKNIVLSRLEKAAELLKIKVSENLDLIKDNDDFNQIIKSNKQIQINHKIEIKTKKGIFTLDKPTLSYIEFEDIMNYFTTSNIEDYDNEDAKTVFTPIISALEKSNLGFEDIDYILFIGGSAKNPLIQKALKEYFEQSSYLIPSNLQAHVSSGAAIHSLMYNGFNKNLIEPITSEPILAMVKEDNSEILTTLLKAGTTIPCEDITINKLQVQRDGQDIIEIPIYIGSKDKLLHNIKIISKNSDGFSISDSIKLILSINVDKILLVKAIINNDEVVDIEPLNPFSNKIAYTKDRKRFEIEKEYNISKANNNGKDDFQSLKKLYDGYEKLGFELYAAEVLEDLYENYDYGSLNNIGVAYSNSGNEEKAMNFYLKDFKETKSQVAALNIAIRYKYSNRLEYEKWLKVSLDIDPNYEHSLYYYGVFLDTNGDDKGMKFINKAFNSWKSKYENGYFYSNINNFISCARYLEEYDYANKLEEERETTLEDDNDYNRDNLTSIKKN